MIFNKVLYAHYRKTDNQIFYVGYGTPTRPYEKRRSKHWKSVVNKHDYYIKILQENLSTKKAKELEIMTIAFYGRKDLGLGTLINKTDGGDGHLGMISKEHGNYNHKIYKFKKGKDIEKCTYHDMITKYPDMKGIQDIIKGNNLTCKGWICLNPDDSFVSKMKRYTFMHDNGTIVHETRKGMVEKYNLTGSNVSNVIHGKRKKHKGWILVNK